MPITVQTEDKNGEVLEAFVDVWAAHHLIKAGETSRLIATIDEYGDTVFNQLQLPWLIEEAEVVWKSASESVRESIELLIGFLQSACDRVHVYVRFIGD